MGVKGIVYKKKYNFILSLFKGQVNNKLSKDKTKPIINGKLGCNFLCEEENCQCFMFSFGHKHVVVQL